MKNDLEELQKSIQNVLPQAKFELKCDTALNMSYLNIEAERKFFCVKQYNNPSSSFTSKLVLCDFFDNPIPIEISHREYIFHKIMQIFQDTKKPVSLKRSEGKLELLLKYIHKNLPEAKAAFRHNYYRGPAPVEELQIQYKHHLLYITYVNENEFQLFDRECRLLPQKPYDVESALKAIWEFFELHFAINREDLGYRTCSGCHYAFRSIDLYMDHKRNCIKSIAIHQIASLIYGSTYGTIHDIMDRVLTETETFEKERQDNNRDLLVPKENKMENQESGSEKSAIDSFRLIERKDKQSEDRAKAIENRVTSWRPAKKAGVAIPNQNHNTTTVTCVDNKGCERALKLGKSYTFLPYPSDTDYKLLRVIDENGESLLYSADRFSNYTNT